MLKVNHYHKCNAPDSIDNEIDNNNFDAIISLHEAENINHLTYLFAYSVWLKDTAIVNVYDK